MNILTIQTEYKLIFRQASHKNKRLCKILSPKEISFLSYAE